MKYKGTFLNGMIENLKRRKTETILTFMILFFAFPLNLILAISRTAQYAMSSPAHRKRALIQAASEVFRFNDGRCILFGFLGLMIGFTAFGYLHKKNKVDMYSSVPVSSEKRFKIILANSLIIVFAALLLCFFICLAIMGAYGIIVLELVLWMFHLFLTGYIFFAGMFSVASLAVCLTGNSITAIFGIVVLAFYEIVFYRFFNAYVGYRIYENFESPRGAWLYILNPKFSVVSYMHEILLIARRGGDYADIMYRSHENIGFFSLPTLYERAMWVPMLLMVLVTVLGIFLTWLCFKRRPAEAAGRSMAFSKTKKIIKYMLIFLLMFFGADFFKELAGSRLAYIIGGIFTAFLVGMSMEAIYESDIKCALKNIKDILIMNLIFIVIFAILIIL